MAERAIGDILATGDRDFLVRNSGEQVILNLHLASCIVLFSPYTFPPCFNDRMHVWAQRMNM